MIHRTEYDIAIIGGGLAGLTMASLLGKQGVPAVCIERSLPTNDKNDLRTTAISYGSRKILQQAGIWRHLEKKACPIDHIEIHDGDSPVLLEFLKKDAENKSFGWIVRNSDLKDAMLRVVKTFKNIKLQFGSGVSGFERDEENVTIFLQNNEFIKARLVIGADGRHSVVRDWMDVRTRSWEYRQQAVICTIQHEHPHHNTAVEHFWPEGPFAILPMTDDEKGNHRSSVVFTKHGSPRPFHRNDLKDFETVLAVRCPEKYGQIRLINRPATYNLSLIHASSYIAPRMVLVADAAHAIHPVAGQGLNLGFRDVKELADRLGKAFQDNLDPGSASLLEDYQRIRGIDNMAMIAVTDGLVRLFSNRSPAVRALRRTGLRLVSKMRPFKQFLIKEAMGAGRASRD